MEERTLELNVISAQNLKKVKNFGHQSCYAVGYISSSDKKSTKVDKEGGTNPTWNAKLTLSCDEKLLQRGRSHITVDIYSHGTFGNKLVGTSKISLLEIGKQAATGAPPKFLSFEVCRRSGKVQGVLNLSVKVGEKRYIADKSGKPFLGFSESYKRIQFQESAMVPISYSSQLFAPSSPGPKSGTLPPPSVGTITPYLPPMVSHRASHADHPGNLSPLHYSANSISIPKTEASVMGYPTSGYSSAYRSHQHYGPKYGGQYSGSHYSGLHQSYHPSTQITALQKHQKVHYAKPSRRPSDHSRCCNNTSDSRGTGMGLLGGVAGGLVLGDVISDIF
ncbi:unnamed protein product [Calypogeia fissa]